MMTHMHILSLSVSKCSANLQTGSMETETWSYGHILAFGKAVKKSVTIVWNTVNSLKVTHSFDNTVLQQYNCLLFVQSACHSLQLSF